MGTNDRITGFEKREHMAIITIPGFTTDDIGTDTFSYELAELCAEIEMDEDIRVVIITAPEEKTLHKGKQCKRTFIFHSPRRNVRSTHLTFQNLLPVLTGQP